MILEKNIFWFRWCILTFSLWSLLWKGHGSSFAVPMVLNFVNVFSLFRNHLPLENNLILPLKKTWIPFTKECFQPNLLKIVQMKIFKFLQFIFPISLFHNYLPLEKGWALHLKKLECSSPKEALCQVWLKLDKWFWRRRFFNLSMYLRYFVIIYPLKREGHFIWTHLSLHQPRMLCAKFG